MPSARPVRSIGIDFGTSNTVVAIATGQDEVATLRFVHDGSGIGTYASALSFWQERAGSGLPVRTEGGPWAIDRVLEGRAGLRFIQSFKTFAASRSFQSTTVFRQRLQFEDLLAAFLRTLARHAGPDLDFAHARLSIGRPVEFSGSNPDDALAMQRYREAFGQLGAGHARFVYEPVGAAFSFARRIAQDATVLVADFGGGTSDFSVIRFARSGGVLKAEPLGHSGVGIAGDSFDARIVDQVVAPCLGKGTSYRSFGKLLPMPSHYYATLARWNELALMKSGNALRQLQELERSALDPAALRAFITLVEEDRGFALYRAVSSAKVALSSQDRVAFRFTEAGLDIAATIERAEFERWIAEDLARIAAAVDQALARAGLAAHQVDKVFLTGGTSFVPAVQRLFTERFGEERLTAADQFESIAQGLALIGLADNPGQWAVTA